MNGHQQRIKEILFSAGGGYPGWLEDQAIGCRDKYSSFDLIPQFQAAIESFSDRSIKPFELFVLGEGKFGKSTLVNALLGEASSKVKGLPETRCFLRYVVSDQPKAECALFMRLKPGVHDWIKALVGPGREVTDLYKIQMYVTSPSIAKRILREECERLDRGRYDAALYEIERQVKKTDRSTFPQGVRIVDTQGLDQLFPDDLVHIGRGSLSQGATERFMDWMSNTTRGKHLEWQFRRCDAVLWCVNAKRIGSAATMASLQYFSTYSKKIVIALTNVDLVARSETDMTRIVDRARQIYGDYVAEIIPVNGQLALEASLAGNQKEKENSGMGNLERSLNTVCVSDAVITRSVSRYLGLRTTETQFRRALHTLRKELLALERKYQSDQVRLASERSLAISAFERQANSLVSQHKSMVLRNINKIDLSDDRVTAKVKMGVSEFVGNVELALRRYLANEVAPGAKIFARSIKPFLIPGFDAEGQISGHLKRIEVDVIFPSTPTIHLGFHINLQNEVFTRARLWFKNKVVGSFSARMRQEAIWEEQQLIKQRHDYLKSEFLSAWEPVYEKWLKDAIKAVLGLYAPISKELAAVLQEVESTQGEPLHRTCERIDHALQTRASNLALLERLVSIMKYGFSARKQTEPKRTKFKQIVSFKI